MINGMFEEPASYDVTTHRLCGCCGEIKPLDQFYKDGLNPDGTVKYRRDCKDCYKCTRARANAMKAKGGHKK